ncbi:PRC-barrel domain-containing protein [Micromonospora sp. WMMD734]|uniref:PRC-barrel domain containing protein n=1 Tax=Micromonospora humidisoli TaxID=2807622 RepID=A0ABS2J4I8_9ACTN|nr:PRC-barrel domain-containing protein [Micromonospora humidisoli]MBM7081458.1 PRC-barrel domain containing protein [Micromonospora humidisoli]
MDRLDPHTAHGTTDPMVDDGQGAIAGGAPGGAFNPWSYRDEAGVADADLVGYKVEATDGGIGKIDEASHEVGGSYLVVDTGPWIFGKKVMLPAGTVNQVDHDDRKVHVDRTRDQIKAAPEYDETSHGDAAYRDKLGGYYDDTYGNLPPGTAR